MKKNILTIILISVITFSYADQWQVLTKEQAENAVEYINQHTDIVLWCACCTDDTKDYVKINKVEYQLGRIVTDMYEVIIHGSDAQGDSVITGIDLAYVHAVKNGTAYCLAVELGLDCDPCTEPFNFDIPEIHYPDANNMLLEKMDFSGPQIEVPEIDYNWGSLDNDPDYIIKAIASWTSDIAFTGDEKFIIAGGGYFEDITGLKKYNIQTGKLVRVYRGHRQQVETIAVSNNGKYMISTDQTGRVIIWDLKTDKILYKFDKAHSDWAEGVCFSYNNKYAASVSRDNYINIWDIKKGKLVRSFKNNFETVSSVSFSRDNKSLIAGGIGVKDEVCIYDLETGEITASFDLHTRWSKSIDTDPSGKFFISAGDDDNDVKMVNLQMNEFFEAAESPFGPTVEACFDPTGQYIAVAATWGIYVWDTHMLSIVFQAKPNKFPMESILFSKSGKYLAASGRDGKVYIWNVRKN